MGSICSKKKKMGSKEILKNWQMGCKFLEIMADGLYAVFHRFEAFLKKVDAHATPCQLSQHKRAVTIGCPSNGRCAFSISTVPAPAAQTSAGRTACSCLSWPAVLPWRPHPPYYSHRWPGHPSTPLTHTPCYSATTAAQPNQ